VSEDVAASLARSLYTNLDEVRAVHGAMAQLTPELLVSQTVLPFHPGAEATYREAGLLK
jgi:TRAP-type uncharacterized transport system substrate-binding protein